ncbi:MAG: efflux transporter outer membrane subunit [Desulfobulbaceae bacterium]|nr:efflux transporter outer membrane subunit [Desulfobulbaceae bacterium]
MNNKNHNTGEPSFRLIPARRNPMFPLLCRTSGRISLMFFCCLPILTSCTLGPDFKPPEAKLSNQWSEQISTASETSSPAAHDLAQWWKIFHDPQLTSLIERAIDTNLDLRIAESRIRQARAAMTIAGANLGPTVDASASYRRSQTPMSGSDSPGVTTNLYRTGFDAAWELDLFGGIRREVEATGAEMDAATENRRDLLVSLSAEVASSYLNLRSLQQRLVIARANLLAQEHTAELTRQRWDAGFNNKLDMVRAEAQAATTSGQIPLLEAAIRQTIYGLSLLLAGEPATLLAELSPDAALPVAMANVPPGLPSELLRRRPDIRRAEANIHAATARIGVATADLFPSFTITGSLGLQNNTFNSTFNQSSRAWSLGPSVNWALFDMGRIRANIELKKAIQEEELLAYEQTVLTALNEVENALVAASKEDEHHKALAIAVTANRTALKLATTLYVAGENDFLSVLDAQRTLYITEEALAQSSKTLCTNLVALFKSLGGGWEGEENNIDGKSPNA